VVAVVAAVACRPCSRLPVGPSLYYLLLVLNCRFCTASAPV
jgi:hypothetical protein